MTDSPLLRHYSYVEYEEIEQGSNVRHEFVEGYIRAMSGGTGRHNAIGFGLGTALRSTRQSSTVV